MRGAISAATNVSYEQMSLVPAFAQLFYGLFQPVFGMLALRKSNAFVLGLGSLLMITGAFLSACASVPAFTVRSEK